MQRRGRSILVLSLAVVMSGCIQSPVEISEETPTVPTVLTTVREPPDLTGRPLVWFAPLPPLPVGSDLPFGEGSADFYDLWNADAPWKTASNRVDVFTFGTTYPLHYVDDEQLRPVLQGIADRGFALGVAVGALHIPDPGECTFGEGFGGSEQLDVLKRIKNLGFTVDVVVFDEPYAFGHIEDSGTSCRWPVETVAHDVAGFVDRARRVFPDAIFGGDEPLWRRPEIGAEDMRTWMDAYQDATGEPLGFLHLDIEWDRPDWPELVNQISRDARDRGVPIGVFYTGGTANDDLGWIQAAADHAYQYEEVSGGTLDHVIFASWTDAPRRVLPDDDPNTFTGLINRYFSSRTSFDEVALSDSNLAATLRSDDGEPIAGAPVTVSFTPLAGVAQTFTLEGQVPDGVSDGLVIIRVNTEGAQPGPADIRIYRVGYAEDGSTRNPDPDFTAGSANWGLYGSGLGSFEESDIGDGRMLVIAAPPDQDVFVDSSSFPVKPGTAYTLSVEAAVSEESARTAYVAIVFMNGDEGTREVLTLEPTADTVREMLTDGSGEIHLAVEGLRPGSYRIDIAYRGDLDHWPAYDETTLQLN